jgi:hypothetical protein
MLNLGCKVTIKYNPSGIFGGLNHDTAILRNITEIHYNYNSYFHITDNRIAFESDLHHTGITYNLSDLLEFETELETELANKF